MKRVLSACFALALAILLLTGCQITASKDFGTNEDLITNEDASSGTSADIWSGSDGDAVPAIGPSEEKLSDQGGEEFPPPEEIKPDTSKVVVSELPEETQSNPEEDEHSVQTNEAQPDTSQDAPVEQSGDVKEDTEADITAESGNVSEVTPDLPVEQPDELPPEQPDEPSPEQQDDPPPEQQDHQSVGTIIGKWGNGSTGAVFNITKGSFDFGAYGFGQEYYFYDDGTFYELITSGLGSAASIFGNYTVNSEIITFSYTSSKVSSDYGETWTAGNTPPPASYYYELGADSNGDYLVIGLEGAEPPLDIETNAVLYYRRSD